MSINNIDVLFTQMIEWCKKDTKNKEDLFICLEESCNKIGLYKSRFPYNAPVQDLIDLCLSKLTKYKLQESISTSKKKCAYCLREIDPALEYHQSCYNEIINFKPELIHYSKTEIIEKVKELLRSEGIQEQIAKMIFDASYGYSQGKFLVDIDVENEELNWGFVTTSTFQNPANLYPNTNCVTLPDYLIGDGSFGDDDFDDWTDIPSEWVDQYIREYEDYDD